MPNRYNRALESVTAVKRNNMLFATNKDEGLTGYYKQKFYKVETSQIIDRIRLNNIMRAMLMNRPRVWVLIQHYSTLLVRTQLLVSEEVLLTTMCDV